MKNAYRQQSDGIPIIEKAPDAVLDYPVDWAAAAPLGPWLASGETIVSQTVTVDPGITKNSVIATPDGAATMVTTWLSGGIVGMVYLVTVEIVTSLSRTDSRSFRVNVIKR